MQASALPQTWSAAAMVQARSRDQAQYCASSGNRSTTDVASPITRTRVSPARIATARPRRDFGFPRPGGEGSILAEGENRVRGLRAIASNNDPIPLTPSLSPPGASGRASSIAPRSSQMRKPCSAGGRRQRPEFRLNGPPGIVYVRAHRMPSSIDRYIFRTTFGAFLLILVSLTGIIWITHALREI